MHNMPFRYISLYLVRFKFFLIKMASLTKVNTTLLPKTICDHSQLPLVITLHLPPHQALICIIIGPYCGHIDISTNI